MRTFITPAWLTTEAEPWLSGKLAALEKGHITPTKEVRISDHIQEAMR